MTTLVAPSTGSVQTTTARVAARGKPGSASLSILLIEDNAADALRLLELLARSPRVDFLVTVVRSVDAALDRIGAGETVDGVLMDLDQPARGALRGVERLVFHAPALPLIGLCSIATEETAYDAMRLGAQDYVLKHQATADSLARALRCAVERSRQLAGLRALSLTDELTGLLNRRGFTTVADTQLRLGNRTGSRFLLLYGDLDGLKAINDTRGHQAGDDALRQTAAVLRSTFRQSDVVGRLGGDEFAILALDQAGDGGRAVLSRLNQGLAAANAMLHGRLTLRLSLGGIAFGTEPEPDLAALLEAADQALYEAKRDARAGG